MNKFSSQTNNHPTAQRAKGRVLLTSICTLFAICATHTDAANIVTQWNFDDAANPFSTVANVGGFTGTFFGATVSRSADSLGVSGFPGDYSLSLGGSGVGVPGARMDVTTPEFLTALNNLTGSQSMSITYWQNLNGPVYTSSTSLWAQSPSVSGMRGLNAHSPWSDGTVYWDTAGCCTGGTQRLSAPLGNPQPFGQWELITLIFDNGNKSIYRGATQLISGGGFFPLTNDHTAFYVGNESPTHDLLPNARYDNFTLWSGALTPAEIALLAVPPVPEPSAAILLGAGSVLALRRRRQS